MSMLIASLTTEVLPLVIERTASNEIWHVLEQALASPSNTRVMSLHASLQGIKQQATESVTQYLHRMKSIRDELRMAGRPLSTNDFNIDVFKGLRSEFKGLVTTLTTRP